MATTETQFSSDFRKALEAFYPDVLVWANSDKFSAGRPDFCVCFAGKFYSIEAKFVKELPSRFTSKVLHHEVSSKQISFLADVRRTGNYSAVLVGSPDVAAVMPTLQPNYTLKELLDAPRIERKGSSWDVTRFLETVERFHDKR